MAKQEYQLEELLGGITAKNLHGEVDFGGPVGKELL
jgi:antitoxin MazE